MGRGKAGGGVNRRKGRIRKVIGMRWEMGEARWDWEGFSVKWEE
jgi:hypothetical protein